MTKTKDGFLDADVKVLSAMRRSATIDWLQWTDNTTSLEFKAKGLKRPGRHSTLHDVTALRLKSLPASVLERPIAGIEVAVDFTPKRATSPEEHVKQLVDTFTVLQRRLIPWNGLYVGNRIYKAWFKGDRKGKIRSGREEAILLPAVRGDPIRIRDLRKIGIVEARVDRDLVIKAPTFYFGHRPSPDWTDYPYQPEACSQVRLYIKVTDDDFPIPRSTWCVRCEVTMNATPVREILGARNVQDLIAAPWHALASQYFVLGRAEPMFRAGLPLPRQRGRPRGGQSSAIVALCRARILELSKRDADVASGDGNFTQREEGSVTFKLEPALTKFMREPLHEFSRSINRP